MSDIEDNQGFAAVGQAGIVQPPQQLIPSPQAINTIDKFDGSSKQDPASWIANDYDIATMYNWSEAACLRAAKIRLQGDAQRWAQANQFTSWSDFSLKLTARFGETQETAIIRLESSYQRSGESPRAFADRFRHDADRAGRMEDAALVYSFIQRLQPNLRDEVVRQRLRSIDAAVEYCNYLIGARVQLGMGFSAAQPADGGSSTPPDRGFRPNPNSGPRRDAFQQPRAFARPQGRAPFRDMSNRGRPANPPVPPKPSPAAPPPSAVDDLTRQLQQLQINLHQQQNTQRQLQDKDRTIRTLRYALERQPQVPDAQLNFMGPDPLCESYEIEAAENDLDPELYTSIMTKRAAEDEPVAYRRMPSKRVAIDPTHSAYAPPRPAPPPPPRGGVPAGPRAPAAAEYAQRPPRQRQPVPRAVPAASNPLTAPQGTVPPLAPRAAADTLYPRNRLSSAADLAESKAKKLAAEISKSIKMDGTSEGTVPPQAVLTCLAGFLAGVPSLVQLGRKMAAQVETVVNDLQRSYRSSPASTALLNLATDPVASASAEQQVPNILNQEVVEDEDEELSPAPLPRPTMVRVPAALGGAYVLAYVDSGASRTTVSLDFLRRKALDHRLRPSEHHYVGASGHLHKSAGRANSLVLQVGGYDTLIHPTVTKALNYDLLIGADVLRAAKAVLDFNKCTLKLRIDPEHVTVIPFADFPEHISLLEAAEPDPSLPPGHVAISGLPTITPAPTADQSFFVVCGEEQEFTPPQRLKHPAPDPNTAATRGTEADPAEVDDPELMDIKDPFSELLPVVNLEDLEDTDTDGSADGEDSELVHPKHLQAVLQRLRAAYTELDPETARLLNSLDALAITNGFTGADDWAEQRPPTPPNSPEEWMDDWPDSPGAPGDLLFVDACATPRPNRPGPEPAQEFNDPGCGYHYVVTTGDPKDPPFFPPPLFDPAETLDALTFREAPDYMRLHFLHFFSRPFLPLMHAWRTLIHLRAAAEKHDVLDELYFWLRNSPDTRRELDFTVKRPFDLLDIPSDPEDYDGPPPPKRSCYGRPSTPHPCKGVLTRGSDMPRNDAVPEDDQPDPDWLGSLDDPSIIFFLEEIPASGEDWADDDLPPSLCSGSESDSSSDYDSTCDPDDYGWDYEDLAGDPYLQYLTLQEEGTPPPATKCPSNKGYTPPDEETCPFPDDDAMADNRHVALSSLVDASNLTAEEYTEIVSLLSDNADIFCFHPSQLGTCKYGRHVIDTGDAKPIKQAYYRMPYAKQQQVKQHIDEWLEMGVIEPSTAAWSSPIHLVPKRGGDTRAVIDYRKLNAVTRKDAHPLPRMDDILYNIGPAKYLTSLDMFSGYMQCQMAGADGEFDPHESMDKTSFCSPFGLYRVRKVSFGLCNAGATFMRTMMQVLQPFIGKFCFVYLDDIVVYSSDWEAHLSNLRSLFQAFREADLKLSPTKCRFAAASCTFLGFVVSERGLSCDPRLIEAIALRPPPCTSKNPKKAVASFVGLCSFYRRFVMNFAAIAEPLTRVMGKHKKFVWGEEQQRAFETLKRRLMSYPILRRPDFGRPFIVHTDASQKAVGAVLTQLDDDGREYTVAYSSSKLTPTQSNWGITELECYAVIDAVCNKFRDFLMGHPFRLKVDHSALKWLMTTPNLQGKLARWSLRLQEFQPFTIEHRPGTSHLAADALSRDPRHEDDFESVSEASDEDPTPPLTPDHPDKDPDLLLTCQSISLTTSESLGSSVPGDAQPDDPGAPPGLEGPDEEAAELAATSEQLDPPGSSLASTDSAEPRPVRICIDGNIGSGKTTIIKRLMALQQSDDPSWQDWEFIPEPVQDWSDLLAKFYQAPPDTPLRQSLAALLQLAVLNAYALRVPHPATCPLAVIERSPHSSLAVFLPCQQLSPVLERVVLQAAHHMHHNLDNALPTALVYLRSDPEVCLERTRLRKRPGEEHVNLQYLQELHKRYEDELERFPGPTFVADANQGEEAVFEAVKQAILTLIWLF